MKIKFNNLFSIFCILIITSITNTTFAQNVVIDYEAWNPSSPPCNIFGGGVNVPCTSNGSATTIQHQTLLGQPDYNASSLAIEMGVYYASASSILGGRYRIAYNFKVNYKYLITISATEAIGGGAGPYLRTDLTNNGGGTGTSCPGAQAIDQNLSGNPPPQQINYATGYGDFQFAYTTALPITYSSLEISAIPATGGGTNAIRIKKITITEAPPPISFSLSPSSVSKVCGTTLNQTFTAIPTYIPPGATVSYLWDLGSSSNGWLYGGSAAPQTITTSGNTLSLSADACTTTPSNVSATVTVNGTNYSTNTVALSSPAFSISGSPFICPSGGSTFSIANLDCSPTVSWVSSPSGVVDIGSPNSPTTLVSYLSNGSTTITATYSSPCGSGTLTYSVTAGNPAPTGTSYYSSNYGSGNTGSITNQYVILGTNHGQPGDNDVAYNYNFTDPNFSSISWTPVSVPSGTSYQITNGGLTLWTYVTYTGTNGSKAITMNLQASGPCGTYSQNITSTAARISGWGGFSMIVAPNPAKGSTKVSLIPDATKEKTSGIQQNSTTQAPLIRTIL